MSFVKGCVQECRQTHAICRQDTHDFVPTRLLHVGLNNEELFICESGAEGLTKPTFTWAALSHCWGGGQPIKLVRDNLSDLHSRVSFDELPSTFRDAIDVARLLEIQYIWIDSMCIIQDDIEDWQQEAAMMGMIYSQAFIVISGASSEEPSIPFLGPRDEDWLPRQFFMTTPTNHTININARRRHLLAAPLEQGLHEPPYTEAWAHDRWKGPLYKRAWCFQETHLAQRTLHFTPGSIIFECRTHRRAEDHLPPDPSLLSPILGQVGDATKWRMVVRQYTSRNLSRSTDKLPAISGVASLLPQAQRTDYLAGIWRESLIHDLLWNVQPQPGEPLSYRGEEYIAPTWSWASLDHAVSWNEFQITALLAEVLEARCEPTGSNRFGQIRSGHIRLRARVRRCKIFWKPERYSYRAYFLDDKGKRSEEKHFTSDGLLVGRRTEQHDGKSAEGVHSFAARAVTSGLPFEGELDAAFVCLAKSTAMSLNHVGLLVTPSVKVKDAWERIGTLLKAGSGWYASGEEAVVTLL
ncbi:hypothetical protein DOTSEDRAFT_74873 [Dothistroma septosporum NZE10]|uniref:Heterokaryon incompatibility domain-containing protein n=1 Tax=Dothistroma septosporum (strain NZE10 / CBS 128990) TaxID=675120 RepID=N1PCI2_DOTSN|nr:hypothetical protein DOTSEDRAFT_74873 [Dothistroma septosporum NZE10]